MLTGNYTYPAWRINSNFVADSPDGPRMAIEFIEDNPLFTIIYKRDARHLAALFAATDLTRSGLSEGEIIKVVKFQKEHLSLYRESLSQYNLLNTLKQALVESDTSLIIDCFVLILQNYHKPNFFISDISDEYKGSEASIFIKASINIALVKPKIKKSEDVVRIRITPFDFNILPSLKIISNIIPTLLDLRSPEITVKIKDYILSELPFILNDKS